MISYRVNEIHVFCFSFCFLPAGGGGIAAIVGWPVA